MNAGYIVFADLILEFKFEKQAGKGASQYYCNEKRNQERTKNEEEMTGGVGEEERGHGGISNLRISNF